MKRLFLVLTIIVVCEMLSYAQTSVFSYGENGTVKVNSNFLMSLENETLEDVTPYPLVKEVSLSISSFKYSVKLKGYKGWEGDPGDFHVIEISCNGKPVFNMNYDDGWDYFYLEDTDGTPDVPFKEINLSADCKALIFTGLTIMSQPPFLTVVLLRNGKATLVYNKRGMIQKMETIGDLVRLKLQLNTVEYHDDHIPYNTAELAELEFKNGMIYYKEMR